MVDCISFHEVKNTSSNKENTITRCSMLALMQLNSPRQVVP